MSEDTLHLDLLAKETHSAFLACKKFPFLSRSTWYLAGGTALALQVGHRQSVDLDFFTEKSSFRETHVERTLFATGKWKTNLREEGTLYGTLMNAKMSFIAYPFFKPSRKRKAVGHMRILIPEDIASMKIIAISQRGRKRDFVDLYWYCKNRESLFDIIVRAINQYPGQEKNMQHILKSLVYFKDAENDPMPKIFFDANWKNIKGYFQREVPRIMRKLLHW